MNSPLLRIKDVCLSYGERHVLCHINEVVKSQDFIVLTGPNGGGKTTLLRLIAGLLPPTCGKIQPARRRIIRGYLPQYRHIDRQFPTTVQQIVLSGLACRKAWWQPFSKKHQEAAEDTLRRFHLLELAASPISDLSGGQWQRTLLARAFVSSPELLLLDEPETHLDVAAREIFYAELSKCLGRCAVVIVSHDEKHLPTLTSRRIWHVENGSVEEESKPLQNSQRIIDC